MSSALGRADERDLGAFCVGHGGGLRFGQRKRHREINGVGLERLRQLSIRRDGRPDVGADDEKNEDDDERGDDLQKYFHRGRGPGGKCRGVRRKSYQTASVQLFRVILNVPSPLSSIIATGCGAFDDRAVEREEDLEVPSDLAKLKHEGARLAVERALFSRRQGCEIRKPCRTRHSYRRT